MEKIVKNNEDKTEDKTEDKKLKDRGTTIDSQHLRLLVYMRSRLPFYKFAPIEQVQASMQNIFAPIVSERNTQKSN